MLRSSYNNFVRSSTSTDAIASHSISGEEAKKLYLEEVNEDLDLSRHNNKNVRNVSRIKHRRKPDNLDISNHKLFTSVQDNKVDNLKEILDACPDKINTTDEYGWSLLMIAVQAKSYEAFKELLKRGIDTKVQDKAGNSARSLIIRNKDSYLADIFLSHTSGCAQSLKSLSAANQNVCLKVERKKRFKDNFVCKTCEGITFHSKEEHLSSTIHNINASKGKKIPTNYVIPQTNKGYQMMLKTGWNKETGLGPDGSGKKYPIKVLQKTDKKGLGLDAKRKKSSNGDSAKQHNKTLKNNYDRNRRFEINFRREFY